jgi:hypothetical protein
MPIDTAQFRAGRRWLSTTPIVVSFMPSLRSLAWNRLSVSVVTEAKRSGLITLSKWFSAVAAVLCVDSARLESFSDSYRSRKSAQEIFCGGW